MKRTIAIILVLLMLPGILPFSAASDEKSVGERATDIGSAYRKVCEYYLANTELLSWWDVLAVKSLKLDMEKFTLPDISHEALIENKGSASFCASRILMLIAAGKRPASFDEPINGMTLVERLISMQQSGGMMGEVNAHIFSVLALSKSIFTDGAWNHASAASALVSARKDDGGFAYAGDKGDVDMTGMAMMALPQLYGYEGVNGSLKDAASFLKSARAENGGFIASWSGVESASSAASALMGLMAASGAEIALEPDFGWSSTVDRLLSFQLPDGGFKDAPGDEEADVFATSQAAIVVGDLYFERSTIAGLAIETGSDERAELETVFLDADDVSAWAVSDVIRAGSSKIMSGSNGYFNPKSPLTRAELAKMISQMFGDEYPEEDGGFADVPETAWYHGGVMKVSAMGFMRGDNNGWFLPEKNVSRQDVAVVVARILKLGGRGEPPADFGDVSDYAGDAVLSVIGSGIMTGDNYGRFHPKNEITREEVSKVMNNAYMRLQVK